LWRGRTGFEPDKSSLSKYDNGKSQSTVIRSIVNRRLLCVSRIEHTIECSNYTLLASGLWSIQGQSCNYFSDLQIDRIRRTRLAISPEGPFSIVPAFLVPANQGTKGSTLDQDLKAHPRTGIRDTQRKGSFV